MGNCTPWFCPIGRPNTHAFLGIGDRLLDEPLGVADALGGDQDALGVHAVEDVAEALAFLADQVLRRDRAGCRRTPPWCRGSSWCGSAGWSGRCPRASRMSTRNTDSPSVRFATSSSGVVRASSSIRSECSRAAGPDLLAVDDVLVAFPHGDVSSAPWCRCRWSARSRRRPAAAARPPRSSAGSALLLGEPCRSSVPIVYICAWQAPPLQPGALDLLQHRRCCRQRQAGAAVLLGDQRGEIAGLGQRLSRRRSG